MVPAFSLYRSQSPPPPHLPQLTCSCLLPFLGLIAHLGPLLPPGMWQGTTASQATCLPTPANLPLPVTSLAGAGGGGGQGGPQAATTALVGGRSLTPLTYRLHLLGVVLAKCTAPHISARRLTTACPLQPPTHSSRLRTHALARARTHMPPRSAHTPTLPRYHPSRTAPTYLPPTMPVHSPATSPCTPATPPPARCVTLHHLPEQPLPASAVPLPR